MAFKPPPPIPAMTRPKIMTHSLVARPQMRLPAAKNKLEKIRPVRRDSMSVSRPLSGCRAALAMKYEEASQESRDKELKEADIGADKVAMIVESNAARNEPNQILLMTTRAFCVLGSSASGTWFSSRLSPGLSVSAPWLDSSSSGVTWTLRSPSSGLASEEGSSALSCSVNAMA